MQQNYSQSENEKSSQQQKVQALSSNINMHILFLSDLPNSVIEDDIKVFFKDYADKIKLISINPSYTNQINKKAKSPTATIIFSDSKSSESAKNKLNLRKIKGKSVRIMWHTKDKNIIENPNTNIFIKNIPDLVTPRDVLEHFSTFGEINSAKIPENEEGFHFGYGYINYLDAAAAKRAIESENGKKVWNSFLEVQQFVDMKARANTLVSNNSSTLYLKDFPEKFSEQNIIEICRNFGEIQSCRKIFSDKAKSSFSQAYAVLTFPNAQTTESVKQALNNVQIEGKFLNAENYKTKGEKFAAAAFSAATDSNPAHNPQLPNYNAYLSNSNNNNNYLPKGTPATTEFIKNNLHVKNIPFEATEADLISCFSKFGDIKSAKIEKMNLVTKVNNEYKEIPTSQGFGYVCFSKAEEAQNAKEAMDGKYLPKFEMWKRPLLIDFFVPKSQRKNMNSFGFASRSETFYPNEGTNMNQSYAQGYMGNMAAMQPNKMDFYASPQKKFVDNNNSANFGYFAQAQQNQDVYNMQQMYQNLPNAPAQQMPFAAQGNRNYPMNPIMPGMNSNIGQTGRSQNQQFYHKEMHPIQNMNAFANPNTNIAYGNLKIFYFAFN